jgi:hypothetical protein
VLLGDLLHLAQSLVALALLVTAQGRLDILLKLNQVVAVKSEVVPARRTGSRLG